MDIFFSILCQFENVYVDTSMVYETKIFISALETFGFKHIVFATDQPYSLVRVQPVVHPTLGLRYMSDLNYHWADPVEQAYYREKIIFKHVSAGLKMMVALKEAIEYLSIENSIVKEKIFFSNAQNILSRTF